MSAAGVMVEEHAVEQYAQQEAVVPDIPNFCREPVTAM
jgi:hypothetical protein